MHKTGARGRRGTQEWPGLECTRGATSGRRALSHHLSPPVWVPPTAARPPAHTGFLCPLLIRR